MRSHTVWAPFDKRRSHFVSQRRTRCTTESVRKRHAKSLYRRICVNKAKTGSGEPNCHHPKNLENHETIKPKIRESVSDPKAHSGLSLGGTLDKPRRPGRVPTRRRERFHRRACRRGRCEQLLRARSGEGGPHKFYSGLSSFHRSGEAPMRDVRVCQV